MAKAELGVKRLCLSCSMRFYDFKRSPIICPGCDTEFNLENMVKSRKSRATAKASRKLDDADETQSEKLDDLDDDETVIDEAQDDDDIDFDEDDDLDVDDADGPGIIQDDLSDDDELLPNLDEKED